MLEPIPEMTVEHMLIWGDLAEIAQELRQSLGKRRRADPRWPTAIEADFADFCIEQFVQDVKRELGDEHLDV